MESFSWHPLEIIEIKILKDIFSVCNFWWEICKNYSLRFKYFLEVYLVSVNYFW